MSHRFLSSVAILVLPIALVVLLAVAFSHFTTQSDATATGKVGPQTANGVWSDIAAFPSMILSPTPGANPLKIKRAAAVGYFPDGNVYVLGGRHGVDGEDVALRTIFKYTPGISGGSWLQKTALLDATQQGSIYTSDMAAGVLTGSSGVRIYAIGGASINGVEVNTTRVYDPVSDSLTTDDPWPASPNRVAGGWGVYNNKMYLFGGYSYPANGGVGGVFTDTWRFDPSQPSGSRWTQLTSANLNLGRAFIASAVVDGKLYAIGGDTWNPSSKQLIPVTNVEMLDLTQANPSWVNVASLPTARGDMGAWGYDSSSPYELAGRIAVAGGVWGTPDNTGYMYDPVTNSWSAFPNMIHATRDYGYTQLNGFLYAMGGYDYSASLPSGANFNQSYDGTQGLPTSTVTPSSTRTATTQPVATATLGSPTATACPPGVWAVVSPIPTAVEGGFATSDGTYAYVAGGYDGAEVIDRFARYDPGTGAWSVLNSMPTSADGTGVVYAPNVNKVYVFGGADDPGNAENVTRIYDVAAGTWSTGTNMLAPRQRFAGVGYYNGQIYVAGGRTDLSGSDAQPQTWRYDPTTNTWTPLASMPIGVGGAGYGIVNGHLYVLSGVDTTGNNSTAVYDYNIATNSWSTLSTTVPVGVNTPGSAVLGGRIWLFGGDDGTLRGARVSGRTPQVEVNITQVYDPVSNSWSSGPSLNDARSDLGGTSVGGSLLAIDGFTSSGVVDTTEMTSPDCNTPTAGVPTSTATRTATPSATRTSPVSDPTAVPSVTIAPSSTPTSCTLTFTDVPPSQTFYQWIRCLACLGIINGYPDGTFKPNANVTRGQLSKIASNSAGFDDTPTGQQFQDVPPTGPGSTFYAYIYRLVIRGYINGYPCGGPGEPCIPPNNLPYFRPNTPVTRGQITKIISNAAGFNDPPSGQQFQDVPVGSTFYTYTYRLVTRGVMSGYPCGAPPAGPCVPPANLPYFRPNNNATRGQTSKIDANTFFPDCNPPRH